MDGGKLPLRPIEDVANEAVIYLHSIDKREWADCISTLMTVIHQRNTAIDMLSQAHDDVCGMFITQRDLNMELAKNADDSEEGDVNLVAMTRRALHAERSADERLQFLGAIRAAITTVIVKAPAS